MSFTDPLCRVCDEPVGGDDRHVVFHPCGHACHQPCDPHASANDLCPACELEKLAELGPLEEPNEQELEALVDTVPCYYCGQPIERAKYIADRDACPCGRAKQTRERAERGESSSALPRAPSLLDEQHMAAWKQKRELR